MKANEAPEKLYVDVRDNLSDSILYGFTEKRTYDDIEYTRTDAFIEKASTWLKNFCNEHYIMSYSDSHEVETKELMEIFIKKMEE